MNSTASTFHRESKCFGLARIKGALADLLLLDRIAEAITKRPPPTTMNLTLEVSP